MKPASWLLLVLLAGGLFAAGAAVLRGGGETPAERFAAVQQRIARGRVGHEQMLADLQRALAFAEQEGDGNTATQIRRVRGQLLLELGAYSEARADLEAVLERSTRTLLEGVQRANGDEALKLVGDAAARTRDREIEGLLVELERRAGNLPEAVRRVELRLAADESHAEAWVQAGEVYAQSAHKRVEDCLTSLARVLVADDEDQARRLLLRGSALDPSDPLRVAVGHDLWQLFAADTDLKRREALEAMDAASAELARARAAFARCLELAPEPRAVSGLLDLFARAQHRDETLDLGIATLPFSDVRSDPDSALILIRTLRESGHLGFAAEFAGWWATEMRNGPAPLYLECCLTLLAAESWTALIPAANRLGQTGHHTLPPQANLFRGLGLVNRGGFVDARKSLTSWLEQENPEPFRGARAMAWEALARCWAELDQPALERDALEQAVATGEELRGESWLRLAELQLEARHGGYRSPEERWARGMSRLPERADELMQRWIEIGERELEVTAFDPEAEHRNMQRTGTWTPRAGLSPFELFRLAQASERDGDPERALTTYRRLAEAVPGFPPALDRSIELALELGYEQQAAELLLQRMRRTGRDAYAVDVLAELDQDVLEREDLLLLMRVDPEVTGRRLVARTYHADGQPARALSALGDLRDASLDPELQVFGIQLLIELGRFSEAALLLDEGPASAGPVDLALCVDAYAGAGRRERLGELVDELAPAHAAPRASWLAAGERLLAAGEVAVARRLLAAAAAAPGAGEALVHAGLAELMGGDADAALRLATRAMAFPTAGRAELLRLVVLVELGRHAELRAAVADLRLSAHRPTQHQELALLLLGDDLPAARERVARARERQALARDPLWALLGAALQALQGEPIELDAYFGPDAAPDAQRLLLGDGGAPRDPRRAAALALALDDELLSIWARAALEGLDPRGEQLWTTFLAQPARPRPGLEPAARSALEWLTGRFPTFAPAWDRLEQLLLAETGARESAQRSELRLRRRQAVGDALDGEKQLELDRAREARAEGRLRRAVHHALSAAAADPGSVEVQRVLAELYTELDYLDKAVEAHDAALALCGPAPEKDLVQAAIDVAVRAFRRGALDAAACSSRLTSLAQRCPDDPAPPLALAAYELTADARNPALGVSRAYAHLDRFRDAHREVAYEDLRAGSAAEWGRFLLALDPERARSFTESQLLAKPGSLEAWILLGEILQAESDLKGALEHVRVVQRMAPREGRVLRKLAELEALNGAGRAFLTQLTSEVREIEGLSDADPELSYWRAMAIMSSGSRGIASSIERLGTVWRHRENLPAHLPLERVGLRLAAALVARGGEEERGQARAVLSEFQAAIEDPYRRDLAAALHGLSLHDATPHAAGR